MSQSEGSLCSLCEAIDIVALIENARSHGSQTIPHHDSYEQLVATAASCRLCAVFQGSLFREGKWEGLSSRTSSSPPIDYFRRTSNTSTSILPDYFRRSSTPKSFLTRVTSSQSDLTRINSSPSIVEDVASWHEELDRRMDGSTFSIECKAESNLDADLAIEYIISYQRRIVAGSPVEPPKPRPLVLSNEVDLGLGVLNRPIGVVPNFSIYSAWVTDCASGGKHNHCHKAEPVQLPTRLIDIGVGAGQNIPKLVTTTGMKGQYLTLSHCWGHQQILKTTKNNLKSHHKGMSLADFPKLFQDAMVITRIMKHRYIWIDTLCIVQDDKADWERECSCMGDVYRSSVCTLSAPSAADSQTSLMVQRAPSDMPPCKLSALRDNIVIGQITIGPPPRQLKESAGVLSTRGWVLQEQMLSPRTLCFGKNGMYFQCHSHEQLESYHHALPPERITSWRTSNASDLPKPLINMAARDAVYWYHIVRQYSFRHLTIGTDKLPAIAGLASTIARKAEDGSCNLGEYWAGLWSKDIGRGLMWKSDPMWDSTKLLHDVDKSVPSWSWASQNTPVEWVSLGDFWSDFDCNLGPVEQATEHRFGRVSSGRLEINAPVKSASLRRQSTPARRIMLCGLADARDIAELFLDNTAEAFFHANWPETETSFRCRLLMSGEAESTQHGKRWYAFVLASLGHGRYRRLGIANSLGYDAIHPRSLSSDQSWNWFGEREAEDVVIV